jgi:predicted RecA/RadA family phage recombinase
MAKNYQQDGSVLTLTAPANGVESGKEYALGTLAYVALTTAAEGAQFAAKTTGVWLLDADKDLTAGAAVGLKNGKIVTVATSGAVACGVVLESGNATADAPLPVLLK